MKPMAIVAGIVAGLIGAAVWCAIAYYAHAEVGFVAWAIGALVGVAVALASRGGADAVSGSLAAIIALCAIGGGKYATVQLYAAPMAKMVADIEITDERAQVNIARDVVYEYAGKNKPLKWPEGMDDRSAKKAADFPKDLWADTLKRWGALKPSGQAALKEKLRTELMGDAQKGLAQMKSNAFWSSFGPFDILWFVLAVGSAYRIGSGNGGRD